MVRRNWKVHPQDANIYRMPWLLNDKRLGSSSQDYGQRCGLRLRMRNMRYAKRPVINFIDCVAPCENTEINTSQKFITLR